MALLPSGPTHLAVRWIHVLAMAILFGGALLCWGMLRRTDARATSTGSPLLVARTYEWLFWAAAGLVVLTGVGNLGALSPAIPRPGTSWGMSFSVKLVGVLLLFVGSLVRTVGVVRVVEAPVVPQQPVLDRLRVAYAATALLLLLIVALGEVLAHG